MHEIELWIETAASAQNIKVGKLSIADAKQVMRETMTRYIKDQAANPRVLWLDLARPIDEFYDRNLVKFSEIVPLKNGLCWLIPETDSCNVIDRPVYELDVTEIERLINDCCGFEYNVVAHDFSWLVIETDHDQYYVVRESDRLPNLMG